MFDQQKPQLTPRTKSVPTAAAVWAISGQKPTVVRRHGEIVFEFPIEAEAALQNFLRLKTVVDRMAEEA